MDYLKGYHQTAIVYSSWGSYSNNEWLFTDDGFTIDNGVTTFTYYDTATGAVGFAGTIVGIIAEDPSTGSATDGRIFIKITDSGTWGKIRGSYYAIIYRNLSDFAVNESGATQYDESYELSEKSYGLPTLQEAIAEYGYSTATDSGYFTLLGSYYTKTVVPGDFGALQGKWYWEDADMYVVIRGNTFLYFTDGDEEYDGIYAPNNNTDDFLSIAGEIVDYCDNGTSGVLYIHTVVPGDYGYQSDKYEAIAWKGLNGDDIAFFLNMENHASLQEAKDKFNDPNNEDQFDPDGFFDFTK
jgi:hypothetical protein